MAASVKNNGLPEGFVLDQPEAQSGQQSNGLPQGFTLDKAPERPKVGVGEKAARIGTQAIVGGIQAASVPYDIAAITSKHLGKALTPIEQRQNLLDDLDYLDEKKRMGIFDESDKKQYDQTLDLLKNPEKAEKFLPKEGYDFDVGSLIEKGAKKAGVDLTPQDSSELAARWIGFIKNPDKALSLMKDPRNLNNTKEIAKALLPTGKEFARGIGASQALEYAADAEYGPIGTMAILALGDLAPGLAAKGLQKVNVKNPVKTGIAKGFKAFTSEEKLDLQKNIIKDFRDAGIQADAGTITGNNLVKHLQTTLEHSALTKGPLEKFKKTLTSDIEKEYGKIAKDLGGTAYQTKHEAGELLKKGLEDSRQLDLDRTRSLYKNAKELGGSEQIFSGNVGEKILQLQKELAPGKLKSGEQQLVKKALDTLESDFLTPEGGLRSTGIDALINNKIALNDLINYEAQGGAKQLLKGVVKEIDNALLRHGEKNPKFARNWKKANEQFAEHAKLFRGNAIKQALLTENAETVFKRMDSVHGIKQVKKALSQTAEGRSLYKNLAATKLEDMIGKNLIDSTTAQLNHGKFSKLLQKSQNKAIANELLGSKGLKTLEKLQKASGRIADSNQKFFNASKTGYQAADVAFYVTLMTDVGRILGGNPWPLARTLGTAYAARRTAKMLADPEFLRILEDVILEESKGNTKSFREAALKLSERGQEIVKTTQGYAREAGKE